MIYSNVKRETDIKITVQTSAGVWLISSRSVTFSLRALCGVLILSSLVSAYVIL